MKYFKTTIIKYTELKNTLVCALRRNAEQYVRSLRRQWKPRLMFSLQLA